MKNLNRKIILISTIILFILVSAGLIAIVNASSETIYSESFDSETSEMDLVSFPDAYNSTYSVNGSLNLENTFPSEFHEENWSNFTDYSCNHDFSEDVIGEVPEGWVNDSAEGCTVKVINLLGVQSKVLEVYDGVDTNIADPLTYTLFEPQETGVVEMKYRSNNVDAGSSSYIRIHDGGLARGILFKIKNGNFHNWDDILVSASSNQWYFLRFTFDCVSDTYNLTIKENNKTGLEIYSGTDLIFRGVLSYINQIRLQIYNGDEGEIMYVDDIVCSLPIIPVPYWDLTSNSEYTLSSYNDNGTVSSWLENGSLSTEMWETSVELQIDTNHYDAFGQLMKVSDDEIHYYFRQSSTHGSDTKGKIVKEVYNLTTETWGSRTTIYDDENSTLDCRNVGGGIINNSIYVFFQRQIMGGGILDGGYIKSTNLTGMEWSNYIDNKFSDVSIYGALISTNVSNTFLQPYYDNSDPSNYTVGTLKTIDNGDSFRKGSIIYNGSVFWCETSIIHIGNGRLIALMRNNSGSRVGQSISSDNGEIWSPISLTNLGDDDDVKITRINYDNETNNVIVMFRDRDGADESRDLITVSNATDVFNNCTAYKTPKVIFEGNRKNGYVSMVKVSYNKWFYVFSDDIIVDGYDADTYGGYLEYYDNVYQSVSKELNHTFNILDLYKSESDLVPYNLKYSYKTNISQLIDFTIWNYDAESWDLVNSSTNKENFYDCNFELNSSHYNSSFDVKLNWYGLNASNDFDLYLNDLSVDYNWTYISGDIYSIIDRDLDFSFLNKYDSGYDNYQKLYNITINFRYRFSNYTSHDYVANIGLVGLITDGDWNEGCYSFDFNSENYDLTNVFFNVSNGLLEISEINYIIFFKCLNVYEGDNVYSFTGETGKTGTDILFVDSAEGGANNSEILASIDGRDEVLHYKSDVNFEILDNTFKERITGTVEFYIRYHDTNTGTNSFHLIDETNDNSITLMFYQNKFQYLTTGWNSIMDVSIDTWYHIKIEFDCASTWDVWVDGVSKGTGLPFKGSPSALDGFRIQGIVDEHMYLDAVNYSWMPKYDVDCYTKIYQNFTLTPELTLTDYQKTTSNLTLEFDYNFTASEDSEVYDFYNGIDDSLLLFKIHIQHEDGWNVLNYSFNESKSETFSLGISNYLDDMSKDEFRGFKLEVLISGNPSSITIDDLKLIDSNPYEAPATDTDDNGDDDDAISDSASETAEETITLPFELNLPLTVFGFLIIVGLTIFLVMFFNRGKKSKNPTRVVKRGHQNKKKKR